MHSGQAGWKQQCGHTTRRLTGMHRNNHGCTADSRIKSAVLHTERKDTQQANATEAAMRHTEYQLAGMNGNDRRGCTPGPTGSNRRCGIQSARMHSRPTRRKRRCGVHSIRLREWTATITYAQRPAGWPAGCDAAYRAQGCTAGPQDRSGDAAYTAHRLAGMHRNNRRGCTAPPGPNPRCGHTPRIGPRESTERLWHRKLAGRY